MKSSHLVGAFVAVGIGVFGFSIALLLRESDPPTRTPSETNAETGVAKPSNTDSSPAAQPSTMARVGPRASTPASAPRAPAKPPAPKPSAIDKFPPVPASLEAMDRTFRDNLVELMALADGDHARWYAQFKKTEESLTEMSLAADGDENTQAALRARNQTFQESVASHGAQ